MKNNEKTMFSESQNKIASSLRDTLSNSSSSWKNLPGKLFSSIMFERERNYKDIIQVKTSI
jgi:hypothetical protein